MPITFGDCRVRDSCRVDGHPGSLWASAEQVGHHDRVEPESVGDVRAACRSVRVSSYPGQFSADDRGRVGAGSDCGAGAAARRRQSALPVRGEHGGLFTEQRDELSIVESFVCGRGDRCRGTADFVDWRRRYCSLSRTGSRCRTSTRQPMRDLGLVGVEQIPVGIQASR